MGGSEFYNVGFGTEASDTFVDLVSQAQYDYGHAGYSGTIAEKHDFVMIPLPEHKDPKDYAKELMRANDGRIIDKYGPAGCIEIPRSNEDKEQYPGLRKFLFFGWASS
jgi:hypothetical protein